MLQQNKPDDFVLATGTTRTVNDFLNAAAELTKEGKVFAMCSNSKFYRPNELHELRGDASKAKRVLGWEPTISFV